MKRTQTVLLATLLVAFWSAIISPMATANEYGKNEYRELTLPNRLRVMLVHNAKLDQSAASLSVAVGSENNPPDMAGLAHFLEHMLFLGTQKYPGANEYQHYLGAHSGGGNAYTAMDHTNYFFTVSDAGLAGALDRFSWFFKKPLFDPHYVERELNAIQSEHDKNIDSDYRRQLQIMKLAYNPNHPLSSFATGNKQTLEKASVADVRTFYQKYYSANVMALSVVSSLPLDALEQMVRENFDAIPDHDYHQKDLPEHYKSDQPLRIFHVKPLKDTRSLQIEFPLPGLAEYWQSHPLSLIGFVLGHEGAGSLLSNLKQRGLATGLMAGASQQHRNYSALSINVSLTKKGTELYKDVLEMVLGAIKKFTDEGLPYYIFKENQLMAALEKEQKDRLNAGRTAQFLSAAMLRYPAKALPEEYMLYSQYSPQLIEEILAKLTPDNMLIVLAAPETQGELKEVYYGIDYSVEVLEPSYVQRLKNSYTSDWQLPQPNPFMPLQISVRQTPRPNKYKLSYVSQLNIDQKDFSASQLEQLGTLVGSVFKSEEDASIQISQAADGLDKDQLAQTLDALQPVPEILFSSDIGKVWHMPPWGLDGPRAAILLRIYLNDSYSSAKNALMAGIYFDMLAEKMNEIAYTMGMAGIAVNGSFSNGHVDLSIEGYSFYMPTVMASFLRNIRTITFNDAIFEWVVENTRRGLGNTKLLPATSQISTYRAEALTKPYITPTAMLDAIDGLTLADVMAFREKMFDRIYINGAVVGNISLQALRFELYEAQKFYANALPQSERIKPQIININSGDTLSFDYPLSGNNSLSYVYHQLGRRNPIDRGALLIIQRALEPRFYASMRTEQQLGYVVWSFMEQDDDILGSGMIVQSSTAQPAEIDQRIAEFIPKFVEEFKNIPDAEFQSYKQAVVDAKLRRPSSMDAQAKFLYWMAFEHNQQFDYVSAEIKAVEELDRDMAAAVLERLFITEPRQASINLEARKN